jgi:hypothetical protein
MLKANIAAELFSAHQGLRPHPGEGRQPDLSHFLRGDFDDYSAERLMKILTAFEQDIEIVMKPHRRAGKPSRITFKAVAA